MLTEDKQFKQNEKGYLHLAADKKMRNEFKSTTSSVLSLSRLLRSGLLSAPDGRSESKVSSPSHVCVMPGKIHEEVKNFHIL